MKYLVECDGKLYKADRVVITESATQSPVHDTGPPPDPMNWWEDLPIGADVGPYRKVDNKCALYKGATLTATVRVDPLYATIMREFL